MEKLACSVQRYLWGKTADESLVAKLTHQTNDSDRYAELWMGTHKKGPSKLASTDQLLSEWIAQQTNVRLGSLCSAITGADDGSLPFLLKILSIDKALSIQVHPNKEKAASLHSSDPEHYPDSNHKPEMAIALTEFEGMCGFRPIPEILENMTNRKELHSHLSSDVVDYILGKAEIPDAKIFIKKLFSELIMLPNSAQLILDEIQSGTPKNTSDKLFLRIHEQHPGDRGLVCIFLLNHVVLQPGECMFLGANKIHAYFSGDCVECMACSDNTVRAGLTGKFVDVDTLLKMLDYTPATAESQKLSIKGDLDKVHSIRSYLPPVKDFAVDRINGIGADLDCIASPRIILCVEGTGVLTSDDQEVSLEAGAVVYIVPNKSARVSEGMMLFIAYCQE